MSTAAAALLAELEQEALATRRVLERVPPDKLAWKPHPKSMSLGQLAGHVAGIPGFISRMAAQDGHDAATSHQQPGQPRSTAEILDRLSASLAEARSVFGALREDQLSTPWRLSFGDREVFTIPRIGVLRTMLLNHWYHHRGQLTVYLRLLDVPVPAVYGRSADEATFD
ncbi:MAG TPA: DinB family protein [Candidatus Eisenbacteria bacterium]